LLCDNYGGSLRLEAAEASETALHSAGAAERLMEGAVPDVAVAAAAVVAVAAAVAAVAVAAVVVAAAAVVADAAAAVTDATDA
jgi:hypothetical protein